MKIDKLKFTLWIISAICAFLIFKTSPDETMSIFKNTSIESWFQPFSNGNTIIFSISMGFIVSMIFYLFVAWLPEKRKRDIIRKHLNKTYNDFKEKVISIFLGINSENNSIDIVKELTDQDKFKKHFNGDKWNKVFNDISDLYKNDLLIELEILLQEIIYVLNNIPITDENVFNFFKNLSKSVYEIKNSSFDYDDKKVVFGFLWHLFTGWSWIEGYRKDDIVKEMIKKI